MSDSNAPPPQSSVPVTERSDGPRGFTMDSMEGALARDTTMAMVVYVLYLVGLATAFAAIVGVVLAHIQRGREFGTWLETHHTYQVRTFWIGLLYMCIGAVTIVVFGLGFLIMAATWVWIAIRTILGIIRLSRREPIPDPDTWLW